VASCDVARSIDTFVQFNRIVNDAIRQGEHTRQLRVFFGIIRQRALGHFRRFVQYDQVVSDD